MAENKSYYFVTNWDDAADYTRALEAMGIAHVVEDPMEGLPLEQGQLAIVTSRLTDRQLLQLQRLFPGEIQLYPR
ncbi:hypothetical protein [Brevibacillus fulvus]|uniref:Uncharacterized protein n=1 Tax=Brevibacillus fulvus TaxID=1125967 RepID=A0A938XRZ6_9BACL|nr:hypothetical protein [Brevibacillus fulvus]MBM7589238.1 hypothetical protein [Brevibacillus fulvus]